MIWESEIKIGNVYIYGVKPSKWGEDQEGHPEGYIKNYKDEDVKSHIIFKNRPYVVLNDTESIKMTGLVKVMPLKREPTLKLKNNLYVPFIKVKMYDTFNKKVQEVYAYTAQELTVDMSMLGDYVGYIEPIDLKKIFRELDISSSGLRNQGGSRTSENFIIRQKSLEIKQLKEELERIRIEKNDAKINLDKTAAELEWYKNLYKNIQK